MHPRSWSSGILLAMVMALCALILNMVSTTGYMVSLGFDRMKAEGSAILSVMGALLPSFDARSIQPAAMAGGFSVDYTSDDTGYRTVVCERDASQHRQQHHDEAWRSSLNFTAPRSTPWLVKSTAPKALSTAASGDTIRR